MIQLFKFKNLLVVLITIGLILPLGIISIRLLVTLYQVPEPQAIFVLGGDVNRMRLAAWLAQKYPDMDIWVSDEPIKYEVDRLAFREAGIKDRRIHYDFCATDTVTNFTCMVKKFIKRDLWHLYLVTSDYHMTRAKVIATLVFGSRGIVVTPITVPWTGIKSESFIRVLRDGIRSIIWLISGRSGASLNPRLQSFLSL